LQKFKFDAQAGPTSNNQDFYTNSWRYSFVHNFKVHYKQSVLQALANKADVSISSATPQIPSTQQVMDEFNQRMQMGNVARENLRKRFSSVSYHVTNIEYKESFAFYDSQTAPKAPPRPQPEPVVQVVTPVASAQSSSSMFCTQCGAQLPAGSRFCNRCGSPVAT
jgi:ribosomal protein L40E